MAAVAAILNFFKRHLLENLKSDWDETLWEALEQRSELLKSFRSNV